MFVCPFFWHIPKVHFQHPYSMVSSPLGLALYFFLSLSVSLSLSFPLSLFLYSPYLFLVSGDKRFCILCGDHHFEKCICCQKVEILRVKKSWEPLKCFFTGFVVGGGLLLLLLPRQPEAGAAPGSTSAKFSLLTVDARHVVIVVVVVFIIDVVVVVAFLVVLKYESHFTWPALSAATNVEGWYNIASCYYKRQA